MLLGVPVVEVGIERPALRLVSRKKVSVLLAAQQTVQVLMEIKRMYATVTGGSLRAGMGKDLQELSEMNKVSDLLQGFGVDFEVKGRMYGVRDASHQQGSCGKSEW